MKKKIMFNENAKKEIRRLKALHDIRMEVEEMKEYEDLKEGNLIIIEEHN